MTADLVARLVDEEVVAACEFLQREPTFDNLADAAEILARAANRVAPDGHRVSFIWERAQRDAESEEHRGHTTDRAPKEDA